MTLPAREQPNVVITTNNPAIAAGKPSTPKYWAKVTCTVTARFGPNDIRTAPPPAPLPSTNGYFFPPAPIAGPFSARWSVEYLPDPASYSAGYYWLGDPSSQDGTASIQSGARQWAPDGGASGVPSWRSFYPFKPSVTSATHYLFGGASVHHPKGVNFNAHFIEHMWMDWGKNQTQPFTWCIAAMTTAYRQHYLLDSGRDPAAVGFPPLTAAQTNLNRTINDGLAYRNMLSISTTTAGLCARPNENQTGTIRCKIDASLRPKMFIGIFNGTNSYVGAYSPGRKLLTKGTVDKTSAQAHRYYVMGRKNGLIGTTFAGELLVFEIRYWSYAISMAALDEQYNQLASRHQFDAYRGL